MFLITVSYTIQSVSFIWKDGHWNHNVITWETMALDVCLWVGFLCDADAGTRSVLMSGIPIWCRWWYQKCAYERDSHVMHMWAPTLWKPLMQETPDWERNVWCAIDVLCQQQYLHPKSAKTFVPGQLLRHWVTLGGVSYWPCWWAGTFYYYQPRGERPYTLSLTLQDKNLVLFRGICYLFR